MVYCQNQDGSPHLELLDFYEGRSLKGIRVELGPKDLPVEIKISQALNRLERVSAGRAANYRRQVESFFQETLFLEDASLIDIPDSDHIVLPRNCKIQQIANQSQPLYLEDPRFVIDKVLWDQLDNDNRAGLILHEIIYRETLSLGHTNSIAARLLNSNITSQRIESMTVADFTTFLRGLEFFTTQIQGVDLLLNDPVKSAPSFYANGNLAQGWVTDQASYSWGSVQLKLRNQVHFFENGQLELAWLRDIQEIMWMGQKLLVGPYEISFFPEGEIRSLTVNSPIHWKSPNAELDLTGALSWYPRNILHQGQVIQGSAMIGRQKALVKNLIVFDSSGFPREVELVSTQELPWMSQKIRWQGRLQLNSQGRVLYGALAEPSDILTHGSLVRFKSFYPITFFEDGQEIESGCLGKGIILRDPSGTSRKFDPGKVIRWNPLGEVSVDPYSSC